jgi:hypothetical protein
MQIEREPLSRWFLPVGHERERRPMASTFCSMQVDMWEQSCVQALQHHLRGRTTQRKKNIIREGKAILTDIIIRSHGIIGYDRENSRILASYH